MAGHLVSSGRGRGNGIARLTWATATWGFGLGSGIGPAIASEGSSAAGFSAIIGDTDGKASWARSASVGDASPGVGLVDEGSGAFGGSAIGSVTVALCGGSAASTFSCTGALGGAAASVT